MGASHAVWLTACAFVIQSVSLCLFFPSLSRKGTPDLDFMIIMYLWVSLHLSTLIEMILVDRDPYGALLSAISMQI